MPERRRFARRLVSPLALAAVAALLLAPLPSAWMGPWQGKILDLGHVPLFAVLVVVLRGTGNSLGLSLLAAVAVAGVAEVVQPHVGRTGDWGDFARGVLGALAGAAAVRAWQRRRSPRRLAGYLALVVALPAWPVAVALPYL